MQIIGLCGPMGSGKDTAAKTLISQFGFHRIAFGDFLRSEVCDFLDLFSDLYGQVSQYLPDDIDQIMRKYAYRGGSVYQKPYPPDIRRLLQFWGTDLRRKQDENYWVKQMDQYIKACKGRDKFIITDVRFPNEVFWIRDNGGIVAQMERADTIVYTEEQLNAHASEKSLAALDIPTKIRNNGTVPELEQNVIQFYKDQLLHAA